MEEKIRDRCRITNVSPARLSKYKKKKYDNQNFNIRIYMNVDVHNQ